MSLRRHLSALVLALLPAACTSSSPQSTSTGDITGTSNAPGTCATSVLNIVFSPMYSAYDGTHIFKVPAVVNGINATALTWSASDPSAVNLEPFTDSLGTSGIMVTAVKAGPVDIVASAGNLCGKTTLTASAATSADWETGNARYNDGITLQPPTPGTPPTMGGGLQTMKTIACTNCHGDTATNGLYKTVSHTPEQTGGFSDDDLVNIFRNGMVPKGGYFDATIVRLDMWQNFHKWEMTDDEARGLVVYLRSLAPAAQTGASNFGGRFMPGDGGGPPGPPPGVGPDAGASD